MMMAIIIMIVIIIVIIPHLIKEDYFSSSPLNTTDTSIRNLLAKFKVNP